jgi:hypothetical protein
LCAGGDCWSSTLGQSPNRTAASHLQWSIHGQSPYETAGSHIQTAPVVPVKARKAGEVSFEFTTKESCNEAAIRSASQIRRRGIDHSAAGCQDLLGICT